MKLICRLLFVLLGLVGLVSCDKNQEHEEYSAHVHKSPSSKDTIDGLTPSEHVMNGHDMEGMDMEEMEEQTSTELLEIDKDLERKANIHIAVAQVKEIYDGARFLGTVAVDERATSIVSARVSGRIEKLYFKNQGVFVQKGQPLYGLYSESLTADLHDYSSALIPRDSISNNALTERLIEGSRKRLELNGVPRSVLDNIGSTGKVPSIVVFPSSASGFLSELMVKEGQYLETGMAIAKLSDLKMLWVETQVFPDDVNMIKKGVPIHVEFEAAPNKIYNGTLVFNNPTLEENKKINLIRIKIDNSDLALKPGMMANVHIVKKTKKTLVIPKSALVLQDMVMVWVQKKDGLYERRMVRTGTESKREVEITDGLMEGERVVTTGSYLLNSEFIVRKGANSMAGMKM